MNSKIILNQPYPLCISRGRNLRIAILISLFVTLFMIIFQPFGLSELPDRSGTPILAGFGLMSFLVLFANLIIIERFFKEEKWKVYKELLWTMWIIFSIGIANFFYTTYFINFNVSILQVFIKLELYTFAIGIFPVSALILFRYQYLLKSNNFSANEIDSHLSENLIRLAAMNDEKTITLGSSNSKENVEINPYFIKYIESKGN